MRHLVSQGPCLPTQTGNCFSTSRRPRNRGVSAFEGTSFIERRSPMAELLFWFFYSSKKYLSFHHTWAECPVQLQPQFPNSTSQNSPDLETFNDFKLLLQPFKVQCLLEKVNREVQKKELSCLIHLFQQGQCFCVKFSRDSRNPIPPSTAPLPQSKANQS